MKEPLEIRAINVKDFNGKLNTIYLWTGSPLACNENLIKEILDESNENGVLVLKKDGELKEYFDVQQILYCGELNRFSYYENGESLARNSFNEYIMKFEEFKKRGRPKKIYIDYNKAISLEE